MEFESDLDKAIKLEGWAERFKKDINDIRLLSAGQNIAPQQLKQLINDVTDLQVQRDPRATQLLSTLEVLNLSLESAERTHQEHKNASLQEKKLQKSADQKLTEYHNLIAQTNKQFVERHPLFDLNKNNHAHNMGVILAEQKKLEDNFAKKETQLEGLFLQSSIKVSPRLQAELREAKKQWEKAITAAEQDNTLAFLVTERQKTYQAKLAELNQVALNTPIAIQTTERKNDRLQLELQVLQARQATGQQKLNLLENIKKLKIAYQSKYGPNCFFEDVALQYQQAKTDMACGKKCIEASQAIASMYQAADKTNQTLDSHLKAKNELNRVKEKAKPIFNKTLGLLQEKVRGFLFHATFLKEQFNRKTQRQINVGNCMPTSGAKRT